MSETTRQQAARVRAAYGENALAVGAIAIAAGLAAGFIIPSTDKENELFGDARDEIVDRGRDLSETKKEQVQHVAERVVQDVKSVASHAAREEGLAG